MGLNRLIRSTANYSFYDEAASRPKFYSLGEEGFRLPRVIWRYGGKGYSYYLYEPYIRKMAEMTGARVFIDCFGGGGSITMAALHMEDKNYRPIFDKVIYNDLDIGVVSMFGVVKNPDTCNELVDRILKTSYCRDAYDEAHTIMQATNNLGPYSEELLKALSPVDLAYYTFIETSMSFNAAGRNFRDIDHNEFNTVDSERRMYRAAIKLLELPPFLSRVEVYNASYEKMIEMQQLSEDVSILFLDPPYTRDSRAINAENSYTKEFSDQQHLEMIKRLTGYTKDRIRVHQGIDHWMVCGYDKISKQKREEGETEYENIYQIFDFDKDVKKINLGAQYRRSSLKETREDDPEEILWLRW